MGAFVNFGADYLAPGRIFFGGRARSTSASSTAAAASASSGCSPTSPTPRETANILGFLWAKEAYGAMLFATAVSDLSIADALAEPRYRPRLLALAREVLAAAPVPVEPFDGFDAGRPRRLGRPARRVQPPLGQDPLRHLPRPDGAAAARPRRRCSTASTGPLSRRTLELIEEIEDGRRACEVANLELLAAYARLQRAGTALNAVITSCRRPTGRAVGPLHGVAIAVKDNIDVAGVVTTNASTVGVAAAGRRADAAVVARAARGRRRPALQDEPARVRAPAASTRPSA